MKSDQVQVQGSLALYAHGKLDELMKSEVTSNLSVASHDAMEMIYAFPTSNV